ncbi:hypothetical protein KY363_01675 [Candidatus Woesearchaeota archaeon]|nr:hypothetical protein [Candidatus Woesearchaeota archaeon]
MISRKLMWILAVPAAAYTAAADYADCPMYSGGYGMMGGYGYGGWLGPVFWLLYVAVAALVFALIFWGVKKWFMDKNEHSHGHSHGHRKH